MIDQEFKTISIHCDNQGEELCLRIEDKDSVTGILNLCWLSERETTELIHELIMAKERLATRKSQISEAIRTTNFGKLHAEFDMKYNPYPVEISAAEAFGRARSDGLIDETIYQAARKYYGKRWFYVGD